MLENIKTDIERLIALYEKERSEHLTEAFGAFGDNKAAKEKIDKLVKEIDRCISLLEN